LRRSAAFAALLFSFSALGSVPAKADVQDPETNLRIYSIGDTALEAEIPDEASPVAEADEPLFSDILDTAHDAASAIASGELGGIQRPTFPSADSAWRSGLAAWRRGDYQAAAVRFEAAATAPRVSSWMLSAASFWAARSHLFDRNPAQVSYWLKLAADEPETFYGLLARRILDMPMPFRWDLDDDDQAALEAAQLTSQGQQAQALIDAGQIARAEQALRTLAGSGSKQLAHGAMIMAERAGMADLAFRLNRLLVRSGIDYHPAAYPIPRWRPEGGFSTDRTLIYALMRQESNFRVGAVSRAGARGVMQLMPATARFVARTTGMSAGDMRRPEVNIALGQRYVEMLLLEGSVDGDLFRLAAAWNGGPGNLERWQRSVADGEDPLLFIETIPAGETRAFIERVLANLWIYRHRFGRTSPSLDSLAAGQWPGYDGIEQTPLEIAEHGQE
jgi:soluble lytic murein transglycosylase